MKVWLTSVSQNLVFQPFQSEAVEVDQSVLLLSKQNFSPEKQPVGDEKASRKDPSDVERIFFHLIPYLGTHFYVCLKDDAARIFSISYAKMGIKFTSFQLHLIE